MSTMAQIQTKTGRTNTELRRWLLYGAGSVLAFGPLHHVDHIIRGNHVGWPVIAAVTPFTFSLLVYPFLLLGLYLTARGRAWAGYWLGFGLAGLALVVSVHFIPTAGYEPPGDIYTPYADPLRYSQTTAPPEWATWFREVYAPYASPLWGVLALVVLASLVISLLVLIGTAIRVRLLSGRW